jgi:hypothetical protein
MKLDVLLLTLLAVPLAAWGPKGHRLAAAASLATLPPELRGWYAGQEAVFVEGSLEPDRQKAFDPGEKSRHRFRLEYYGSPGGVPLEEAKAFRQLGKKAFAKAGCLPWALGARYQALVAAFRSGDQASVLTESAWLCHYVADSQVPLHTTRNNDGQETDQEGVHARWEQSLVDWKVDTVPEPRPAKVLAGPLQAPFPWLAEAHALVPALLEADRLAFQGAYPKGSGRPWKEPAWTRLWDLQGKSLQQQLRLASERTGGLLLTAWTQAGSPASGSRK